MPAFRTTGSTGQATNTVWFGALPDRLNMLAPAGVSGPLNQIVSNMIPAHFANLWTTSGVTLGAFTPAPDGTTNVAQAITEDTSTGTHYLATATTFTGMQGGSLTGALRLAGFFKNNGRRIGLQCAAIAGTTGTVYAIFDLAGGQIGVAGTTTGSLSIKVLNTQIIRSLNGFYLCILDFAMQGVSNELFITAFLDSGTGTSALSNSYTGGGSAGVFGWRTNMMPISAYGINNTIFLDHFNDLSSIDQTNSKAAGFKWYVDANWANWMLNGALPFDPTWLSITGGTILNITQNKQNLNAITLQTTVQLTPPNYIGTTFSNAKPTLYEIRRADLLNTVRGQFIGTFWAQDMTWAASNSTGPNSGKLSLGREVDFLESDYFIGSTVSYPHVGGVFYNSIVNAFSTIGPNHATVNGQTVGSTPLYYSPQAYGVGTNAVNGSDGIRYEAIQSGFVPPGNPPPSVGKWVELDYPNGASPNFPATPFDQAQLHTYSVLVAPYYASSQAGPNGFDAAGVMMAFTDGLMISFATYWNPLIPITGETTSTQMHTTDGHQMAIAIGADAGSGTAGITMQIDFVRVMQ